MEIQGGMLLVVTIVFTSTAYILAYRKVLRIASVSHRPLHTFYSRPQYYGAFVALACAIPCTLIVSIWLMSEPFILSHILTAKIRTTFPHLHPTEYSLWLTKLRSLASGHGTLVDTDPQLDALATSYITMKHMSRTILICILVIIGFGTGAIALNKISPSFNARQRVETIVTVLIGCCAVFAIFITIGIVASVLFESLRFFEVVPPWKFLFGVHWSPQIAMRADQVASSGSFGAVPVFLGTFLISLIALAVAVPIGLFAAIYTAEYASRKSRTIIKPILEILAGIPTVVYGFFAALMVGPFIRSLIERWGFDVSSESALAAGVVMGIMIIPFISSISDDAISVVPLSLREGAYALGSTKSEMIRKVILPAALPGIAGGVLLAVSRAIGETMIVVMAAGLSARLTLNPFEAVTTVTVQIVTLLIGDEEFDNPKTLAAFALGLVLFLVTLVLNVISLTIVRRYREQYE